MFPCQPSLVSLSLAKPVLVPGYGRSHANVYGATSQTGCGLVIQIRNADDNIRIPRTGTAPVAAADRVIVAPCLDGASISVCFSRMMCCGLQ